MMKWKKDVKDTEKNRSAIEEFKFFLHLTGIQDLRAKVIRVQI